MSEFLNYMHESMNKGFDDMIWDIAITCWYDHGNGD